jgi:CheY-like chemotaxis protein
MAPVSSWLLKRMTQQQGVHSCILPLAGSVDLPAIRLLPQLLTYLSRARHPVGPENNHLHIGPEFVVPYAKVMDHVKVDARLSPDMPAPGRCRDLSFDGRQSVDATQILIVDTDSSRCHDIAAMIQTIGQLEALVAHSSHDALTIAAECLPGFVLLNTDVTDLGCYRLATLLHQSAVLCDSRLIALTTDITSIDRRAALTAGFEQFLTLPLQQIALESVLTGRSHRGPERARFG